MPHRTLGRRQALAVIGTGLTIPIAGCTNGSGSDAETVAVGPDGEFVFQPGTSEPLEITSGTTVTFVWESSGHNIHVDSQPSDADWPGHEPIETEGFEHEHTFEETGDYHYWCEPHRQAGMVADITVEADSGLY